MTWGVSWRSLAAFCDRYLASSSVRRRRLAAVFVFTFGEEKLIPALPLARFTVTGPAECTGAGPGFPMRWLMVKVRDGAREVIQINWQ